MKSLLPGLVLTAIWASAVSPSAFSAPVSPSTLAPRADEIALEGTVTALKSDGSSLQLRATAFSTSRGASRTLPVPKTKEIQIGPATRVLETGSGKTFAISRLPIGTVVRVIGRDGGTSKPLVARLIAVSAPLTETLPLSPSTSVTPVLPPNPDTPPTIAALLPPPQQQGHYILRIIDGGFKRASTLFKTEKNSRPVFFYTYTLTDTNADPTDTNAVPKATQNTWGAQQALKLVSISGPDNQTIGSADGGPFFHPDGSLGGIIASFHGVRPEWKSLKAVWEMLDPAAPPTAKGEITSSLTFHDVPAPQEWDKSLAVNQTLTTPRGTKLVLESVHTQKLPPSNPYKGVTVFNISSTPAPDAKATFDFAGFGDDQGKAWKYLGWGDGSEGNVQTSVNVDALPEPDAKTMTVTVKVTEKVPALQDPAFYYRFEQEIPVASLLKAAPLAAAPDTDTVLARAESPEVALEVERDSPWDKSGWNGVLWVQNRHSTEAQDQWLVRSAEAHSDKGEAIKSWADWTDHDRLIWRLSGRAATPTEHSTPLSLGFNGDKPDKVDVDVKLEAARYMEDWSWLRAIPLPPSGALELKAGQKEDDFVSIKRVFWFKNGEELLGLNPEARHAYKEGGLAVVVEQTPLFPDAQTSIKTVAAFDDQNRLVEGYSTFFNGDAGRAGTANIPLKTLIIPMVPGPKTVDLWLNTTETQWQGRTQTLTLHNIPMK